MWGEDDDWEVPSGRVPCERCERPWCPGCQGASTRGNGFGAVVLMALVVSVWHYFEGPGAEQGAARTVAREARARTASTGAAQKPRSARHATSSRTVQKQHRQEPAADAAGGAAPNGTPTRACQPAAASAPD
jgi:hypothetical protein